MITQNVVETIKTKYEIIKPELDERAKRIWAASEAQTLGHGGIRATSMATGLAQSTIRRGMGELPSLSNLQRHSSGKRRIRHPGAGRKSLTSKNSALLKQLDDLVDPTSRGDPGSPLRWTCKSTRRLAQELNQLGYCLSHTKVAQLLKELDYSLQATRKTMEGKSHPDRNGQFEFIHEKVKAYQKRKQPVISVDTKKKELIGQFENRGKEYQPKGHPEKVETYDFRSLSDGKGIPYGIYDLKKNEGWVSLGVDHDTAQFAVHSIRQWWHEMGREAYSKARELLITADGGGSNGSRSRLWKYELQRFSDETKLKIMVCHFPPGTSKWNKIEHRMFSHITKNWRGRPLTSYEVIVNLIANTRTEKGLRIQAGIDRGEYPRGVKITKKEMREIKLSRDTYHGEWNYVISHR